MINQFLDFECSNLSLMLGGKNLFENFSFKFSGPGVVMIEGENGTGKSSLLKVFSGFIISKNAQISYSGHFLTEILSKDFSCFTTTSLGLLNDLTGMEHVDIVSNALHLDRHLVKLKILEYQELELFREILIKPVSDFSQGMKQFLRLFLHLFFEPKILFLDEPFLYLSPKLKEFFQNKIEFMSFDSLIFITDQKFTWLPKAKNDKIVLGVK
jgi:ABC-type multidrug transport system ATPase subunit